MEWIVNLGQVNPFKGRGTGTRRVGYTQGSIKVAGWTPGERGTVSSWMSLQFVLAPTDTITLFAPQPDPKDPSRINIAYELNGQPGQMDGVVRNDGYVTFTIRTGPGKLVRWNAP